MIKVKQDRTGLRDAESRGGNEWVSRTGLSLVRHVRSVWRGNRACEAK